MVRNFISLPFRPDRRPRWYGSLGYAVAMLGVAAATAILWVAQPIVNLGTVNLVYLLVVVGVAVGWGLGQGMLASFLSFLTANFFFTEPRFSFSVASLQDVLALVVLLAMAILTSQLVAGLRRESEAARRGHQAALQVEVLRRIDAARVALLSAVAHDLRTPLATIKAGATNLLNPHMAWSDEDRREFLLVISAQVDHVNHLLVNLLDMSRIEQGYLRLNKVPYRIGDVIETVLERLQPALSAHPVEVNLNPGLPTVPMDAVSIDEVLTNLLENAAKYTPAGTPIHISAHCDNGFMYVQVADAGPGLPQESLPYLFQRFYRAPAGEGSKSDTIAQAGNPGNTGSIGGSASLAAGRGWGLGLAIVKGIVEAHGGQVSGANQAGGGAIFTFTLPLQESDTAAGAAPTTTLDEQGTMPQPQSQSQPQPQPSQAAVRDRAKA